MNKKFLILPIVSALLLAGCTLGGKKSNRKKKSSSAVITSSVTSGGNTSQGGGGNTSQGGGGNTSQPSGSSSTPAPTDWSSAEASAFSTAFHGIVPAYFSVGLDSEESQAEYGYFVSKATTEAIADAYYNGLDSTWEIAYDADGYEEKHKTPTDNTGYVVCYVGGDLSGNIFVVWQWYSPVTSLSLSGTQNTEFDVGDTFSYEGLVVTVNFKDGDTMSFDSVEDIEYYFTVTSPDMTTAGQKTITVSYSVDETTTVTASYTINVKSSVKYTVSFDGGEGTGTMSDVEASEGSYTLPGSTFVAPEGKAFAGWKANNTGDLIPAGGTYNLTAAVTFYAQWANEYTVSFSAGEGSGTMDPVKVGEGGKISEPTCTFTAPTGKEFDKWVIGTEAVTFPYTVTGNVTLTATWKEKATPVQSVKYTIDNPADQYGKKFSELTADQILSGFVSNGANVITEVKDYNANVYFGGNGGSGDTAFTIVDAFKLGKSKAKGEATVVIGSGYSFSKLVLTVVGQRDDGSLTVNGVEKAVTAKAGPGDLTTQTLEFDIASGTTEFVMSSKDDSTGNFSIYILSLEFVA